MDQSTALTALTALANCCLSLNRPNRPTWYITLITLLPKHSASMAEKKTVKQKVSKKSVAQAWQTKLTM